MSKLVYTALTSLDGYIEDDSGNFDWAVPDAEVHEFVNSLEASVGTHLYGRRLYEIMASWQTLDEAAGVPPAEAAYAGIWRGMDKVVYSRTLTEIRTPRTQLERDFDADAIRNLKVVSDRDIGIGGPDLAQHAFRAGIVDELHLFLFPVVVGGGKPGLPKDVRLHLELLDEHRLANGVVHLHHRILGGG
jgi:dihydrofolate reductase